MIRIGRTFSFDLAPGDWPLEPTMTGKTLVVLSARGNSVLHLAKCANTGTTLIHTSPLAPTISGLHETPFTRLQSSIRSSVTNGIVAHGAMLKRESSQLRWN